jgi:hypothetical protein|tara:strand:- start:874 stop:1335 length:462 start_codon:yes stop_codon:yes gene_type:complete
MRKKLTKSSKVIQYIKKNPNARAKEIASAVGVPTASVYQIAYKVRKQIREGMAKVRMTALAPKLAASKTTRGMKVIATYTSNKSIKSDMVNHPPHYKAGGIETIDFIEAKNLGYNLGNVVKYVSRADLKGNKLEDLQKARWYLDRAIANISKT